jgi:DNA-binding NarL/FixJ family response regulator
VIIMNQNEIEKTIYEEELFSSEKLNVSPSPRPPVSPSSITIVIADDHPIFRRGLRGVIETDSQLKVVDEAENGITALELIQKSKPDVAILDVHMPQMGGLELARTIKEKDIQVELIFLTMYKDRAMFNAAMDLGVKGYVLKDSAINEIIGCIKSVAAGESYITPALSSFLLDRIERTNTLAKQNRIFDTLTKTERRVLKLIAEDRTSKEIGELLFIHPRTVDNHRTNICQKLDLHGSHALLRFALKHKPELSEE